MAQLDRQPDPVLAPSATRAPSTLHLRVLRLLDHARRRGARVERWKALCAACVLSLAVCAAGQVAPLVVFVFLEAEAGIQGSPDERGLQPPRDERGPASPVAERTSAGSDGGARVLPAPAVRRARSGAVLASRKQPVLGVVPAQPGAHARAGATADQIPTASPERTAPVRVHARPNPGAVLLLTAPTVQPQSVVATVRDQDLGSERSHGPWVATGQRAAAAGVAAGTGAKRASTSIAGFFTRAGKALAQSF